MAEPLKNKRVIGTWDEKECIYYPDFDVKSAVEWLKEELKKLDIEHASTDMTDARYSLAAVGLIDKAFPDLNRYKGGKG